MVKQTIRIYCRVKPTKQISSNLLYEAEEDDNSNSLISFNIPRDLAKGFVNNKKQVYKFRFDNVFDQNTKQEEVFEVISKPVIENVLAGYNGTLFAYGQTGSGKTFTITGGAERYADRGVIPRTLSYIFAQYELNSTFEYTTHVSYLEIYNENGYDLLDPRHEASKLEDLPKVNLLEDNDGNIHLRNLSVHSARNEEDALNLLFLGDTNRMIAETPMNQASTRSHCIFTIHITAKDPGTATLRRSKLHLVDLAGSERVSKTGVDGTLLAEAKFINLSLHYLEQVIIALAEKSRSHIPYRNSMMTSVLRDSLGGNCMTSMIATCSVEKKNIDESISTCRFAQRVAQIKNDATLNEEVDPKLLIAQLKREIQQLKDELAMATGQEYDGQLTDDDKNSLQNLVRIYLEDREEEAILAVGADMRKINYCFHLLKKLYHENSSQIASVSARSSSRQEAALPSRADNNYLASVTEVNRLKELILQRDNEINILVGMLKKEKANTVKAKRNADEFRSDAAKYSNESRESQSRGQSSHNSLVNERSVDSLNRNRSLEARSEFKKPDISDERPVIDTDKFGSLNRSSVSKNTDDMSVARQEAFEIFKRDYSQNHGAHDKKQTLKERYTEARTLGEQVNQSRKSINTIKTQIEQQRIRHSMQGLTGDVAMGQPDSEEQKLRELLNQEKATYREAFNQLKSMKTEIEHLQHLLEKSKVQMQKDFEIWWAEAAGKQNLDNHIPGNSKTAWRTPPDTPERPLQDILKSARRGHSRKKERSNTPLSNASIQDNARTSRSSREAINTLDHGHDPGKFASRLRAEAQLASSIFSSQSSADNSLLGQRETINSDFSKSHRKKMTSGIQLTGDSRTDADIIAFMKARQNLMQNKDRG